MFGRNKTEEKKASEASEPAKPAVKILDELGFAIAFDRGVWSVVYGNGVSQPATVSELLLWNILLELRKK